MLWKLPIDKEMTRKCHVTVTGLSSFTVNKLAHGDNVTTGMPLRICKAPDCNIGDVADVADTEDKR